MLHREGRIDRYLAGDLDMGAAVSLRAHLSGCARCRAYYDSQVVLLRGLAGNPERPTPAEDARMVERALAAVGLATPRPKRSLLDRMLARPFAYGAAALAVVLLLVGIGLFGVQPEGPAATLMRANAVTIDGMPATRGAVVRVGQKIHVGDKGAAELEVARGGRVKLYPGADAELGRRGENVDLRLGRVWCEVDHDHGAFTVTTDRGVARVLGTSFVVERTRDGETDVRVMKGTVEVEDRERAGKVRVEANHRTRIGRSGAPSPSRHYSADGDRNDWEKFWNDLGRFFEKIFHQ
jgi:ferric-dicitrate binding protein FerR (iron transport regulator)